MENKKSYFVTSDKEEVYELSTSKTKQLEKKHPNWTKYQNYDNFEELKEVYDFFKTNGKLIAHPKFLNVFVGLTLN
jgi:hypothetical protein